ncbi:MAG TPA: hypothetical protein VHG72_17800, partial [Polyangia bacterium]|nr:hypothetical protein [Polyangia bacterium]
GTGGAGVSTGGASGGATGGATGTGGTMATATGGTVGGTGGTTAGGEASAGGCACDSAAAARHTVPAALLVGLSALSLALRRRRSPALPPSNRR